MIQDGAASAHRLSRRPRGVRGFLLIDGLIAAAISIAALATLVNLMPQLMEASERRGSTAVMTSYALAKQQEMLADDYADVLSSNNGDFVGLLGANCPDVGSYGWQYTSVVTIPGVSRKVSLVVENTKLNISTDTFTFIVVDLKDEVAS